MSIDRIRQIKTSFCVHGVIAAVIVLFWGSFGTSYRRIIIKT